MAYKVLIAVEKNGKQAVFSELNNIEAIEHSADGDQATFRFHTGAGAALSLGNARLVILDKNPALQKVLGSPPVNTQGVPTITPSELPNAPEANKTTLPA